MTASTQRRFVAALSHAQQLNDAFVRGAPDWPRTVNWQELGRGVPERTLTAEEIAAAMANCQAVAQSDDSVGVITLKRHGVLPEYFPAADVGYLMEVLTHPDMRGLHERLLGGSSVFVDHHSMLNRPAGYCGQPFHR